MHAAGTNRTPNRNKRAAAIPRLKQPVHWSLIQLIDSFNEDIVRHNCYDFVYSRLPYPETVLCGSHLFISYP